jgi:aminopeptidase-like protein
MTLDPQPDILPLVRDLCGFATGVVAADNGPFFDRLRQELPLRLRRYPSGTAFNGWTVPQLWRVHRAEVRKGRRLLFDGTRHPLAVATYSRPFRGEVDLEELKRHLVTNPALPSAHVYHCMWQYRPWDADWALCVPHDVCKDWGPGRYEVDIVTTYEPGVMLVGEYEHAGRDERTVVFNAHTCHPGQANDDFASVAVLVRLFQWLGTQDTFYTYRLVLGPEHLGTVFYLRDQGPQDLHRLVCGAFAEMPGTGGPVKLASTFPGGQVIDRAFRNAVRHHTRSHVCVPWRMGAGNDETVWEAPGYEVPFVEVSRCEDQFAPYREYHSSLDTADLMDPGQLAEFYRVFQKTVEILEHNATLRRHFDGLVCLSNPQYDLYLERPDPAVTKDLAADAEKWGHLLDCLFRYFDGSVTILDIAEKHDLPFDRLYRYLARFRDKGLVRFDFAPVSRRPVTQAVAGVGEATA